jgi:glycosyltransferase involved in cell wall biosynthesis
LNLSNQINTLTEKIKVKDRSNGKALALRFQMPLHSVKEFPVISVIIPVLQEEKLLEQTLRNYPKDLRYKYNIELIVSDGGSTDRTLEIAERYADIVVKHDGSHRQTIAEGRNKGAEASSGNILVFINGDTFPENTEKFFVYISNWEQHTSDNLNISALACPVSVAPDEILFRDKIFYMLHNFYVWLLNSIGIGMGRGECQIIKRDIFLKTGGYNQKIAAGEDFDLYRRISKIGKIKFAGEILVYESPRRFRRYGYFRILLSWTINSLSVMFRGRSVAREWEAVR